MGRVLVEAPESEPVSLDEAKNHSRVDSDLTADDSLIEDTLIPSAREYLERQTRRQLVTATWKLYLDNFPEWEIELPLPPLQSVDEVKYVDLDGVMQTLDEDAYEVDVSSCPGRLAPAYGEVWPASREKMGAVEITFTAGYGEPADVPASLRRAILELVAHAYRNREAVDPESLKPVPLAVESTIRTFKVYRPCA